MAKKITHEGVAGFSGRGTTKTEARERYVEKLEEAVSGDYRPDVIVLGRDIAVVWREPFYGWVYRCVWGFDGGSVAQSPKTQSWGWNTVSVSDRASTIAAARMHLLDARPATEPIPEWANDAERRELASRRAARAKIAEADLREVVAKIGLGFHPDTPGREYVKDDGSRSFPDFDADHIDRVVRAAIHELGSDKTYAIAAEVLGHPASDDDLVTVGHEMPDGTIVRK